MTEVAHMPEHQQTERTLFGFWMYIMSDCVLFASLFATYVVLRNNTAGGPLSADIFNLPFVFIETIILLTSSFTCGLAILALYRKRSRTALISFAITAILGLVFIAMEISEFRHLIAEGAAWQRSGFLSAFFTLVGTHGLHVGAGVLWIGVLMIHIIYRGITETVLRRALAFSLFWHFLDIVWIFIFSIVYLLGVI